MDNAQDLYEILGVSREAEVDDLRAAYHALARRLHPDRNKHAGAELQFRDIAAAWEKLGDRKLKKQYDDSHGRIQEPVYFNVQVTPSKRVLPLLGEPQVLYVLVTVKANPDLASEETFHAPLNLSLVLDRSSSMRGARLDRVKVAAHQIIDQLGENDYLSIISFSDRADVLAESVNVTDRNALKAAVSMMTASGGTEIFQGLQAGFQEVRKRVKTNSVNHVILLTDGQTYDAESMSLDLADTAAQKGIGISAMGIGEEWNDDFLDELASRTGGASAYINSPGAVVRFLNDRVRSLGSAYGERLTISIAPDPDVRLDSVFKLIPSPQPISHETQPIQIGTLEANRSIKLLLQLQMPNDIQPGFRPLLRLDITGDVLQQNRTHYKVLTDLSIEVAQNPRAEDPPRVILDALGKLTLYRMQQKAEVAIQGGNIEEATRRLENLATRLLVAGQDQLAQTAMMEARRVKQTQALSEAGRKTIKFGTRMLLLSVGDDDEVGDKKA